MIMLRVAFQMNLIKTFLFLLLLSTNSFCKAQSSKEKNYEVAVYYFPTIMLIPLMNGGMEKVGLNGIW